MIIKSAITSLGTSKGLNTLSVETENKWILLHLFISLQEFDSSYGAANTYEATFHQITKIYLVNQIFNNTEKYKLNFNPLNLHMYLME